MQDVTTFSLAGSLRVVPGWLAGCACALCAFWMTGCTSLELDLAANPAAWSSTQARQWEAATASERQRDFAAARQQYLALQQASPQHTEVTHRLGVVCTHLGQYDEAERALLAALRQRPLDPDIHNDLGYLHHLQGHLGLAKMQYQEALSLRPSDALITSNLAAVDRLVTQRLAKLPVISIQAAGSVSISAAPAVPPVLTAPVPTPAAEVTTVAAQPTAALSFVTPPEVPPSLLMAQSPPVSTASWDTSDTVATAVNPVSQIQTVAFEAPASLTPASAYELPPLPSGQPPVSISLPSVPVSVQSVPMVTQAVSTTQLPAQPAVRGPTIPSVATAGTAPARLKPVPALPQITPQSAPQKLPQITPGASALPLVHQGDVVSPPETVESSPVSWVGRPATSEVSPSDLGWSATPAPAPADEAFVRPWLAPAQDAPLSPPPRPAPLPVNRAPARNTPAAAPAKRIQAPAPRPVQRSATGDMPQTAVPVPASLKQPVVHASVPAAPALDASIETAIIPVSGAQPATELPPTPAHFAIAPIIPDAACEVPVPPSGEAAPFPADAFPGDDAANAFLESQQVEIALQGDATIMKGFCPVTLRDQRQLVTGSSSYWFEYQGVRYQFASLAARTQFCSHPDWYVPVSNGQDLVSQQDGTAKTGRLDFALWYVRRLYVFDSIEHLHRFRQTPGHFAGL